MPVLLAAAACAQLGGETAGVPEPTTAPAVPSSAPRVVGAETPESRESQRIVAAYGGVYNDPQLEALLGQVVQRLTKASEAPSTGFRVTVLNSPTINAFALPSGDLYITRGLIALANDTSEVAAVIAHEMGHVTARHAFARADRERQAVLVSRVITDVLNDPEGGALSLAKSKIALAQFSREQELEADRISVNTLKRAGYDPYGMARFLNDMGRNAQLHASLLGEGSGQSVDFLSTHPATPERVEQATQLAHSLSAPGQGERDRDGFLDAIEGMVYGDDPTQGVIHGNRFYQPVLGFFFQAPPGYTLENTSQAVVGLGPDGSALRLDAVKMPGGQSLVDHLKADMMDGITVANAETREINGIPAAIATARGHDWDFRLAALSFGSQVYRLVFAVRHLTPDVDARLMASIGSFRRMTADEITAIRPQRIAIVKVQPRDTAESLARRMAVDSRPLQRFLVLNDLPEGSEPTPGKRVKLIVQ
ncbi:MAG TPA: M48 family metalloprotease [Hyphomicrobiales bacterium]|nr:M48 family metalloprotease [Hyphomicrobiales bacterium]